MIISNRPGIGYPKNSRTLSWDYHHLPCYTRMWGYEYHILDRTKWKMMGMAQHFEDPWGYTYWVIFSTRYLLVQFTHVGPVTDFHAIHVMWLYFGRASPMFLVEINLGDIIRADGWCHLRYCRNALSLVMFKVNKLIHHVLCLTCLGGFLICQALECGVSGWLYLPHAATVWRPSTVNFGIHGYPRVFRWF